VSDDTGDAVSAFDTLYTVLLELCAVGAPFMPFTMEYIYRHLTDESVHLADWPAAVPERVDTRLNTEVRQIRYIIEGGRRLREKHRINLRQPLSHIRLSGIDADSVERFSRLLKSQLNIKSIFREEAPEGFALKQVRIDAKKMGPVLKGDLKKVMALLKNGDYRDNSDGTLLVDHHMIQGSDYSVEFLPIHDNEAVWSDKGLVVALCLSISEDLKIEGVARNLNRFVQDLRKQLKLPYDRRIGLAIEADGIYGQSLAVYKNWLMEQTLSDSLVSEVSELHFEKHDEDGNLKIQLWEQAG
jgi:isoleucyl-tRNA synthetase